MLQRPPYMHAREHHHQRDLTGGREPIPFRQPGDEGLCVQTSRTDGQTSSLAITP